MATFTVADYILFSIMLCISASIGLFYACTGGKQKTTTEYLMAGRNMSWIPVGLSLLASFMSAITLLGTPAEVYTFGTHYWMIGLSYALFIPVVAYIYLPMFHKLQVTSANEYLELRFNRAVRLCGTITYVLQMVLYMAIVLYAPALALNAVTGISVEFSVLSVGIVCTFYTTLGGMKAVVWTDVFQITVMFAGMLAVIIKGTMEVGGLSEVWAIAHRGERVEWIDFNPDPTQRHTFWSLTIGGAFTWLTIYGVNQAQVQRYLVVPRLADSRKALLVNLPGLMALLSLCAFAGLVIYAHYEGCDPITAEYILANDQLLPYFVMEILSFLPGLPGLFVACIFSGAMSTVSSGLNSLAAITLEDIVKPCYPMSDGRATIVSKFIAATYGALAIGFGFLAGMMGPVLQAALALFGMIGGPLLGLFTLGMFFPCANSRGAICGIVSGLLMMFWVGIGAQVSQPSVYRPPVSIEDCVFGSVNNTSTTMMSNSTFLDFTTTAAADEEIHWHLRDTLYSLSYLWYSALGSSTTVVVGLLASWLAGCEISDTIDGRLIFPFFDRFCCCLPLSEKTKKLLRCGVNYKEPTIHVTQSQAILKNGSKGSNLVDEEEDMGDTNPLTEELDETKPVEFSVEDETITNPFSSETAL